jgi:hypothetical protein
MIFQGAIDWLKNKLTKTKDIPAPEFIPPRDWKEEKPTMASPTPTTRTFITPAMINDVASGKNMMINIEIGSIRDDSKKTYRNPQTFRNGQDYVEGLMKKAGELASKLEGDSKSPEATATTHQLENVMKSLEKLCDLEATSTEDAKVTLADTATDWLIENPFEATKMRDACDENNITMPKPIDDWIRERSTPSPTIGMGGSIGG